jgi:hypothetical protein
MNLLDAKLQHEKPTMLQNSINTLIEHKIQSKEEILAQIALPRNELELLCGFENGQSPFSENIHPAPVLKLIK